MNTLKKLVLVLSLSLLSSISFAGEQTVDEYCTEMAEFTVFVSEYKDKLPKEEAIRIVTQYAKSEGMSEARLENLLMLVDVAYDTGFTGEELREGIYNSCYKFYKGRTDING